MDHLSSAILFVVFNKVDTTKEVFYAIREAKPKKLYLASDQGRIADAQERKSVQEIRDFILNKIDWDCQVETLFHTENQGCRKALTQALNWFFEHEEMGIILEDDCVPSKSFFPYQQELLTRYKNDERIMCVSGINMLEQKTYSNSSYFFSEVPLIWGWGSWRRAWNLQVEAIQNFMEIKKLNIPLTTDRKANRMWWKQISRNYQGEIDTWDYLWSFTNLINNGLTIIPSKNLVKNIGLGHVSATHTKYRDESKIIEPKELHFPLSHPPFIGSNTQYDKHLYQVNFNLGNIFQKVRSKIRVLKGRYSIKDQKGRK